VATSLKRQPFIRLAAQSMQLGIISSLWSIIGVILYLSYPDNFTHAMLVLAASQVYFLAMVSEFEVSRSSPFKR